MIDWNAVILAFINGPGSSLAVMFLGVLGLIFGIACLRYFRWSDRETHKENRMESKYRLLEQRLAKLDEAARVESPPTLTETYEGR